MKRILIVGGGFGGTYAAIHLERALKSASGDQNVQITLLSRDNYYLMTPLLFEAGSGVLEARHVVNPIRPLLKRATFVEAEVRRADLDERVIYATHRTSHAAYAIAYDILVVALGATTNLQLVNGSENALLFKTLADAIVLRNHVIDRFEQASIEPDSERRKRLLSFAIVGGGLVGVELAGELRHFLSSIRRSYPGIRGDEIRLHLIEASKDILSEFDPKLRSYAKRVFLKKRIEIVTGAPVERIDPGAVRLKSGARYLCETIVYAAGITAPPVLDTFAVARDKRGRIVVDSTMRSVSRPEVWALGDCAAIPRPRGGIYPALAQHALREAKFVAKNVAGSLTGGAPRPFAYTTRGTLAMLGGFRGMGTIMGVRIYGILAWWVWRTYYLLQMPQLERRLRILIDWTVALFFPPDIAELDVKAARPGLLVGSAPPPRDGIETTRELPTN